MNYTNPKYLREDHPARNTLLAELGAEFRHPAWVDFKPVEPDRPLAKDTYNTLEGAWKHFYEWRVPQ